MTDQDHTTDAAVYNGLIVEYSPVNAGLAELEQRYGGVIFPVETKAGMKDAKEVRSKLVKLRTGLEALRKEIKEPALRRTQAIDSEAKLITAAIRNIEEPIDAQIKAEEARIEAEKAAKAAKLAEIQGKIDGIRGLPLAVAGCTADEIAAERDALDAFEPVEEVFGELLADCIEAKRECILALCDLYDRVLAQELAAEKVQAEAERVAQAEREAAAKLAEERAAFEAEKAAYEAEKRAFEAQRAAAVASSGAESEPAVDLQFAMMTKTVTKEELREMMDQPAPAVRFDVMPEVVVTPAEAAQVFTETAPEIETVETSWAVRRAALATANQFNALAEKVFLCGVDSFAAELRNAAMALRNGQFDAALAAADHEAIVAADNALIDATMNCIDALSEEHKAAA